MHASEVSHRLFFFLAQLTVSIATPQVFLHHHHHHLQICRLVWFQPDSALTMAAVILSALHSRGLPLFCFSSTKSLESAGIHTNWLNVQRKAQISASFHSWSTFDIAAERTMFLSGQIQESAQHWLVQQAAWKVHLNHPD